MQGYGDLLSLLTLTCMENSLPPESPPYRGYRILVADDNAINCHIAKRLLENLGCEVELASSGEDALSRHILRPYDLILLDCQMPDLDGYQVCRSIRNAESGKRHTPIIGWTAHAHQEEIDKCSAAGMDDCLSKHLRLDGLAHMLRLWLMPHGSASLSPHPSDVSGLEAMHRISGAGFPELGSLFEEDMPQRLLELSRVIATADYLAIARIAHMMSGCCASIGALHLSDLCHDLETQAKSCQHEGLHQQLATIEAGYEQVRLTLHAMTRGR